MKAIIAANLASNLFSRKNLIQAIKTAGWEISAMACADPASFRFESELFIPFYPLKMENKGMGMLADIRTFFSFYQFYLKKKPDVVLHFNSKPVIYGSLAASLLGIPSINNITGLGAVFDGKGGLVRKIVCMLYRTAFSGKKVFVFFQNRDDRDLFISSGIVKEEKTGLLPGSGVDISLFLPSEKSNAASLPLNSPKTRFLFPGRLVLSKGIREFISAAAFVHASYPDTFFDIIGEMNTAAGFIPESEIRALENSSYISYHGNVSDVPSFIAKADCIVLPSYYREGVPRTLLEAAAMGKPLIAADSIGTREPVRSGINGFLCRSADIQDLADTMIRFICLPQTEKLHMGKESRLIAETEYSDKIIIRKYLEKLPNNVNKTAETS